MDTNTNNSNSSAPNPGNAIPSVYRVLHLTVQRVAVSIKNLSSNGAFIVAVEEDKQIIVWVGSNCSSEDAELAKTIAETIVKRDFRENGNVQIPTVVEGEESTDILEQLLDLFWTTSSIYFSKANAKDRKRELINSSVSVGLVEEGSTPGTFEFQETAFAHPDAQGVVPRVTFVPIEMNTIAYVNVGDHWDVWFSRAVSDDQVEKVMTFVRSTVAAHLALTDGTTTRQNNILAQYVKLVKQGEESTLFRRPMKIFTDYEPPGKCAPRPDPSPRLHKVASDKMKLHVLTKQASAGIKEPVFRHDQEEENVGSTFGGDLNPVMMAPPRLDTPSPAVVREEEAVEPVDFWSVGPNGSRRYTGSSRPTMYESTTRRKHDGSIGFDSHSVTAEMLQVIEEANDTPDVRKRVMEDATLNPKSLIGYQVEIDDGVYAGVFVVTEVKKNLLQQTLFHLCALDKDEFWIRLRRNNKSGKAFRPLRRVVRVNFGTSSVPSPPVSPTNASVHGNGNSSRPVSFGQDAEVNVNDQEAEEYALILNEYGGDDDN